MKTRLIPRAICAVLLSLLISTANGICGTKEAPIVIRTTHNEGPDSTWNKAVMKFEELAESYTNGKVDVQIYPNGALSNGDNLLMAQQVANGTLEMITLSGSFWPRFKLPELAYFQLPFLFDSTDQAFALYRGPETREVMKKWDTIGVKMVDVWTRAYAVISNNKRPIKTQEDLKGLRMRGSEAGLVYETWKLLGASSVPISFGELYTALQLGTADGQMNPFGTMYGVKLNEVQKYMTESTWYPGNVTVNFNKAFWDKLPSDTQRALEKSAIEAGNYFKAIEASSEKEYAGRMVKESNVQLYTLPPAENKRWKETLRPVYAKYKDQLGGASYVDNIIQLLDTKYK
jgi:tripartite ATP-independent transporter DctP family solute receptor